MYSLIIGTFLIIGRSFPSMLEEGGCVRVFSELLLLLTYIRQLYHSPGC